MAEMGIGYGSECHLLRYLGRHRQELDRQVLGATGGQSIEWLDYPFDERRTWFDGEWKGLGFLEEKSPAAIAWIKAWPRSGNPPNWDAIGKINIGSVTEWLLVEAKANTQELRSSCTASDKGGRQLIMETMASTKGALGVAADHDWLNDYYQYANRVTVLNILTTAGLPARLLNIYFVGDRGDANRNCPPTVKGWDDAIAAMKSHVGLPASHSLKSRMHELFLHVCPL